MTKEQKKRIEEFIVNNIKTIEKIHQDIASCENLLGYNTNSYGEIYIKDLNDKLRKQIQNHREYQTKLLDEKNRISESFSKLSHIQKYLINERLVEISDSIMFGEIPDSIAFGERYCNTPLGNKVGQNYVMS